LADDNKTAALRRAIEAIEKKSKGLKPSGVLDLPPAEARREAGFGQAPRDLAPWSETRLGQAPNRKPFKPKALEPKALEPKTFKPKNLKQKDVQQKDLNQTEFKTTEFKTTEFKANEFKEKPVKRPPARRSTRPQSSSDADNNSVGESARKGFDEAPLGHDPFQTNPNTWPDGPSRGAEAKNVTSTNFAPTESETESIEASDRAMLRRAALNLLAQREQTAFELKQKLSRRFPDQASLLDAVIARLQAQGLQNDSRMAEAYVRYRVQRGQGPMKIRSEMSQKGLAGSVMDDAFRSQAPDWFSLAASVLHKRFGDAESNAGIDRKERAKRSRFLQQRGFHYEHISAAL
jgi:regulatory protein